VVLVILRAFKYLLEREAIMFSDFDRCESRPWRLPVAPQDGTTCPLFLQRLSSASQKRRSFHACAHLAPRFSDGTALAVLSPTVGLPHTHGDDQTAIAPDHANELKALSANGCQMEKRGLVF